MKQRNKLLSVLVLLALLLSLTGCKNQKTDNKTTYPLTLQDSAGVNVTLNQEPMKVVSLGPNITEIICALDAKEKLVGRTNYCDYPADVSSIPSIGDIYPVDVEAVISLEPDLVIGSTHFSEEDAGKLTNLGIQTLILEDGTTLDSVYTMIQAAGQALNRNKEAVKLIGQMKTEIQKITDAVKNETAPSVYYVVGYGEYGDYTAGGDTFIGNMLALAGGDNIAKDVSGWSYSLENLLEADPQIIIIGKGYKDDFVHSANYKELTAVKEDRVYEIDNNLLDRQGNRNVEGLQVLATLLHPDCFK